MPAPHYFDPHPRVASRPGSVLLDLPEGRLALQADRGVFAASRADAGTLALLRAIPPPPAAGHLLDLGCGYGPIACTLARRAPGTIVWAVDVNSRALELTAANAARLGCGNVRVVAPAEIPDTATFAGIWSNPPIRVGKRALHDLLAAWLPRMSPGAVAWLVVHRNLGADSLAAWLVAHGWQADRYRSKQGYRILRVAGPSGMSTGAAPG